MTSAGPGTGPARLWYWIGGAIVLGGTVAGVLWGLLGFVGLSDEIDDFARVPIDGGGSVVIPEAGGYTIYYEGPSGDLDGVVPEGQVSLVAEEGGEPVALEDYGGRLIYDFGGHAGKALFTFEIDSPGRFVLESSAAGPGELAVGPGVGGRLVGTVVGAVLLALGGVIIGAVVLIVTAVGRHNARRSAGSSPPPRGHPGEPWPPTAPPA